MQRGFNLVELMITVAVIGILAAIAYPSYERYVQRGNRALVRTAMLELQSRQESFFADRKRYTASLEDELNYPADEFYIGPDGEPSSDSSGATYLVSVSNLTPADKPLKYEIVAVPQNQQENDTTCGTLTLKSTGKKLASGSGGSECWK